MTKWGRRRLVRRALPLLPPSTPVRRVIGAQTRGYRVQWLVWMAVFLLLWLPTGLLLFTGRWVGIVGYLLMPWWLVSYELGWLVSLRVVAFRLLAVTDRTVYILDCGHNAFWWPKRLAGAIPRAILESPTGRAGWISIGADWLWVPLMWRRQLRWADWESLARGPFPAEATAAESPSPL